MTSTSDAGTPRYPMRVVTRRTGLSPDVLRIWERRYAVVAPSRSPGGQRLYSSEDLERLLLLRRLVDDGHRIAGIARLPLDELHRLANEISGQSEAVELSAGDLGSIHEEMLSAVADLDDGGLASLLRRTAMSLGTSAWIDEVVAPFLTSVGTRWHAGAISPAHEHLATVTTRENLAWVIRSASEAATGPLIVVATLAEEHHELGAMIAAATAADAGWRVRYLGPNLPVDSIAAAVGQLGASAVAISVISPESFDVAANELRRLRAALPDVAIIVGGQAVDGQAERLASVGVTHASDARALRSALRAITTPSG